jgi:hypothetical protein
MSKDKDKAKPSDTESTVDRSAKSPGFFQKLKSVFRKGEAQPPAPKPARKKAPAAKKGSTSFMQSFKVREVGRDRDDVEPAQTSPKQEPEWAGELKKPESKSAKPQSILLSPDTDKLEHAEAKKKSTLDLSKKESSPPPAPTSEKPKDDRSQSTAPFEPGKKTKRNLKKETIRGLIPLPPVSGQAKPSPGLTPPTPPRTIPEPPAKASDASVLTKGTLTEKIKVEGMEPPPPPPVVSKPATQPIKPLLEDDKDKAKSSTGRVDPQSIVIRPDTDKIRSTQRTMTGETDQKGSKPQTGQIKPQSTLLRPEDDEGQERTPIEPGGKAKAKPATGPVRPESIVVKPDTGPIKDVPKQAGKADPQQTGMNIEGIQPPPPPKRKAPEPKPIEPALKEVAKSKPDTGPVAPQSIVIRPDTGRMDKQEVPGEKGKLKEVAKPTDQPATPPAVPKVTAKASPISPKATPKKGPVPVAAKPRPKAQASTVAAAMSERAGERKKKPKVVLAEPAARQRRSIAWKGGLIALLLLLIGIAAYFLIGYQDTQLVVQIQEGDRQVDPQVYVVLNIAGKLEIIRQEYQRRLQPIDGEIAELQQYLTSSRADLAGKTERLNLLQEALDKNQNDIPKFLEESKLKLDELWTGRGADLDSAYQNKKQALLDAIEQRAGLLNIPYVPNPEVDAIPVAVNAFRLALYGQRTGIDIPGERRWAESILEDWDSYQEEWRGQQIDLKKAALKIKKEPADKIKGAEQQVDLLLREIGAVQLDLRMLSSEVTRYEELLADAKVRRDQAIPPFLEEIGRVPADFQVAEFPLEADGNLVARNLQDTEQLREGDYYVLVQARQGDELCWAVKAVTIVPNQINSIVIQSSDFRSFTEILEGNADILLTQADVLDQP